MKAGARRSSRGSIPSFAFAALLAAAPASAIGKRGPQSWLAEFETTFELSTFYRGNTHTHTLRSDGDSAPEAAIAWYRDHGYQFVVMTDHNRAAVPGEFASLETPGFKVIAGEEVSYASPNPKIQPGSERSEISIHVNSICSQRTLGGRKMKPARVALQAAISEVLKQPGAVAQINHPNYEWALTRDDLLSARGAALMEVANQHPFVRNEGDSRHPAVETQWDALLSAGRRIYGVASDDMHDLVSDPGYEPRRPGKGWVAVAADELAGPSVCRALAGGRFYSSNGVRLSSIRAERSRLTLRIDSPDTREAGSEPTTEFIGRDGRVLATASGLEPSYVPRGDEMYVRARVTGADGHRAWTQPVFLKPRN